MRTVLTLAAVAALVIAGCSTEDPAATPETTTPSRSSPVVSTTTSSSAAPTSSETPTPTTEPAAVAPPVVQAPVPAPVYEAPVFVRCYLADGTALMSDGTTTYMDTCNESAGGPYLLEDGTSIYDNLPTTYYVPPPAADYLRPGWSCDGPAYLCRDDNASGKTAGQ